MQPAVLSSGNAQRVDRLRGSVSSSSCEIPTKCSLVSVRQRRFEHTVVQRVYRPETRAHFRNLKISLSAVFRHRSIAIIPSCKQASVFHTTSFIFHLTANQRVWLQSHATRLPFRGVRLNIDRLFITFAQKELSKAFLNGAVNLYKSLYVREGGGMSIQCLANSEYNVCTC